MVTSVDDETLYTDAANVPVTMFSEKVTWKMAGLAKMGVAQPVVAEYGTIDATVGGTMSARARTATQRKAEKMSNTGMEHTPRESEMAHPR